MPAKGFLGRFKKKQDEQAGKEEAPGPPQHSERGDQSMQYVVLPSALEYSGVRKKEVAPVTKEGKEEPPAESMADSKGELPRCPACGWAIGFEDTACMNCGRKLR